MSSCAKCNFCILCKLMWESIGVQAGRPDRTYIQQLCENTGYRPEDLPEAMNDREMWRGSGISVLATRHDDDDDISLVESKMYKNFLHQVFIKHIRFKISTIILRAT